MLTIHPLQASDVACLGMRDLRGHVAPSEAAAYCRQRGLFGLAAKQDGRLTGLAVACSHPEALVVTGLRGTPRACRLLLRRLTRQAGERDLSVWCPTRCRRLAKLLGNAGFVLVYESRFQGEPAFLYRLHGGDGQSGKDFA